MRVVFGEGFDQAAWPGPLGAVSNHLAPAAVLGEAWAGPLGLLGILETALGLSGPNDVSEAERAASIVPALRAREGPWSASLENGADQLAVGRAVLGVRDTLLLAGLPNHDPPDDRIGSRLCAFLEVARCAAGGLPERIAAVERAARQRSVDIERIELVDDPPWPLLRRALAALATAGVTIAPRPVRPSDARGDLGAARAAPFTPVADGSLQLLRGDCLDETAAEVAAHLAGLLLTDHASKVVLIGPDSALDAALARMGLPTVGARGEASDDALLQVAPLLVALAWPERDPERALELLTLPSSPVRRVVAMRLARAVAREPGLGSRRWQEALAEALARLPEAERGDAAARVEEVWGGEVAGASMSLALLERRLGIARRWLFGRRSRAEEPSVLAAIAQVAHASRIARALGVDAFSRIEVTRILAEATDAVRGKGQRPAQAGFAVVGDAAAVVAPATHVVWWRFSAQSEQLGAPPILSADERRGLMAAGALLEPSAVFAERRARAYARPLLCAGQTLLLAAARRDARGDEQHTHPLWDEIVARAGGDHAVAPLVGRVSRHSRNLAKKRFNGRQLPPPLAEWRAPPNAVPGPASESPTSREQLLGCSFAAAMQRAGLSSRALSLPDADRLFGELAHEVLAEVLRAQPSSGEQAAAHARAAFDVAIARRAATLLRPEESGQRYRAREAVARAAARLQEVLDERGLTVRAVEEEIVKHNEGRTVRGRPDLIVGDPPVIIDIKSGADAIHRKALEEGTAVQLIAYAALLREANQPWPELGYFQVRAARLHTTSVELGGAQAIEPRVPVEVGVARFQRGVRRADTELARGVLSAPGVGVRVPTAPTASTASTVRDGELAIAPPCQSCAFGALCGRLLPGGAGDA